MKTDALIARNVAKSQLEEQEKEVYAERRQRELELQKVRKEADEKKLLQERFQHRIVSPLHESGVSWASYITHECTMLPTSLMSVLGFLYHS